MAADGYMCDEFKSGARKQSGRAKAMNGPEILTSGMKILKSATDTDRSSSVQYAGAYRYE